MSKKKIASIEGNKPIAIESDKLFQELGFGEDDSVILNLKAKLYIEIVKSVRAKNLKQRQIAEILGTDQSRVSEIINGKLEKFTIDKLLEYTHKLNSKIRVDVIEERRVAL